MSGLIRIFFLFAAASVLTPFRAGAVFQDSMGSPGLILRRLHQLDEQSEFLPTCIISDDEHVGIPRIQAKQVGYGITGFNMEPLNDHQCFLQLFDRYSRHSSTLAQLAPARSGVRTDAASIYELNPAEVVECQD